MAIKKSDGKTPSPTGNDSSDSSRSPQKQKRGRGRGSVGRDAIVSSTRELLRAVPPASLSRKSVAEASNVDPALVRYYFSDLRHLLTEVLKILVAEYRERFDQLEFDPEEPGDAIEKRIRHIVTFLAQEPSYHDLFIEQIINGKDEWAKDTRDNFTDTFFGSMNSLIEKGRADGIFREDFDSRFVYIAIIGAAHFLGTSRPIFERLFGRDMNPTDLSDQYADFLSDIILGGISRKVPRQAQDS